MLETIFGAYKDKNNLDHVFVRKLVHKFIIYAILGIFTIYQAILLAERPMNGFNTMILSYISIFELLYTIMLANAYLKLKKGDTLKAGLFQRWSIRRYWKYYNRKTYGWKLFGIYRHNGSYMEGSLAAKDNKSMGEDFMGVIGISMRLTKAMCDPFYKRQYKYRFNNHCVGIDTLNRLSGAMVIDPQRKNQYDDKQSYAEQTSEAAREAGNAAFNRGFYDGGGF